MRHIHPIALLRQVLGLDPSIKTDILLNSISFGNPGANWVICPEYLRKNSIVYSFGVGMDISFDKELLIRWLGIKVFAFDPTPRSIAWLRRKLLPKNFIFIPWGLGGRDGLAYFSSPSGKNVSYKKAEKGEKYQIYSIKTILKKLKHKKVDLMKMDIEGFEYEVVKSLKKLETISLPKQLLIEFHHRFDNFSKKDTENAVAILRKLGYKLYNVTQGQEYSFILT